MIAITYKFDVYTASSDGRLVFHKFQLGSFTRLWIILVNQQSDDTIIRVPFSFRGRYIFYTKLCSTGFCSRSRRIPVFILIVHFLSRIFYGFNFLCACPHRHGRGKKKTQKIIWGASTDNDNWGLKQCVWWGLSTKDVMPSRVLYHLWWTGTTTRRKTSLSIYLAANSCSFFLLVNCNLWL